MLDGLFGEPPARFHPVAWMGQVLNWLEAGAPRCGPARLLYGLGVAVALPFGWSWVARAVEQRFPWPVQALLLKPTFAGRALMRAIAECLDHIAGFRPQLK